MLKDFVYLLLSVIRILLIAYSYSGAGMEYDQAIVLFPIVDYTKQKKNWKRIKDAIAYCSWFSQPKKVVWKFCTSGTLHIFISSTHKKRYKFLFSAPVSLMGSKTI